MKLCNLALIVPRLPTSFELVFSNTLNIQKGVNVCFHEALNSRFRYVKEEEFRECVIHEYIYHSYQNTTDASTRKY